MTEPAPEQQPAPYDFAAQGFDFIPAADSTDPLPATKQDPAIAAALAVLDILPKQLDHIRDDETIKTDLERVEKLNATYEEQAKLLQALHENLYARRQARLDHVEQQFPTGPGIDAGSSPADAAVMQTAFRAALKDARTATFDQRQAMLADALKFGDQTTVRALLTAARENQDERLVDAWAMATRNQELVSEFRSLHAQMNGGHEGLGWELKARNMPRRPPEVVELHDLREQEAKAQAQRELERDQRLAARLGINVSLLRARRERQRQERERDARLQAQTVQQ
ncbi:hypothetical protein ITP53_16515 [Nonomuraea sp. K274]|uniref:Uncharacterized protein n=1 Tax=Nonomuraea cypriaca TaxID=1187855 RepID=A0A931A6T2_9ACTN|nr:hypothetical protein [Nonomuraea cypriaca]MBF8187306.1 hypothetical protein [Nonomuraea cypriaca]